MIPAPKVDVYDTGDSIWYGRLTAFFRNNRDGISPEERRAMLRDLRETGNAFTGGGAAPLFYIVLED